MKNALILLAGGTGTRFSNKKVPVKKINYKINYSFCFFIASSYSWLVDGKKWFKRQSLC